MTEHEEDFDETKKERKAARKMASKRDRSKYKKTDSEKREKLHEIEKQKKIAKKELARGRVLAIQGNQVLVEHGGKQIFCVLKGSLKQEMLHDKNLVTVGDFVLFEHLQEKEGIVHHIEERRSVLSRLEHLNRRQKQLIAANIDQVLITVSVVSPPLKPSLIDRYIIAACKGGMQPVLVINKIDLLEESGEERALFELCVQTYRSLNIAVIVVSTETKEGLGALIEQMKGKASVFSGQSGVGKSSLINAVTELALPVGEIVGKTNKGAHTTTNAHLIPLKCDGWCIDTPGIRSFGVWDLKKEDLYAYFPEIYERSRLCKYADCNHFHEPGCALKAGLDLGEISTLRLDSYLKLLSEVV